jgi:POT family proton-dependent oligopeptide transporter
MPNQTLWGHPKGLYILFFTEMWERFSYYGMRAIFILYLTAKTTEANAGLGWDKVSALELYGWYTMLVYVMSVPGGFLADRWLDKKKRSWWVVSCCALVILYWLLMKFGHFTPESFLLF